jgi:hypothetical protein
MKYRGKVQQGVVILEAGARLPEGSEVTVDWTPSNNGANDPLFDMGDLSEDTGIKDLSVNADHYLYGHPKASRAN